MMPQNEVGNFPLQHLFAVRFYCINAMGTPPRLDTLERVSCDETGNSLYKTGTYHQACIFVDSETCRWLLSDILIPDYA